MENDLLEQLHKNLYCRINSNELIDAHTIYNTTLIFKYGLQPINLVFLQVLPSVDKRSKTIRVVIVVVLAPFF